MVTYIRCPYCGHPEVEATALYCPACDGELQGDTSAAESMETPTLGSLNSGSSALELEALLDLSSQSADTGEVLDLAAKAPTLDPSMGLNNLLLESEADAAATGVSLARTPSVSTNQTFQKSSTVLVTPQPNRAGNASAWGAHVYLLLVGVCIAGFLFTLPPPKSDAGTAPARLGSEAQEGLRALEAERYAAAIKFLEKATQNGANQNLLPSLALAYSRTSQLERAREVMRRYRIGLQSDDVEIEEGSP